MAGAQKWLPMLFSKVRNTFLEWVLGELGKGQDIENLVPKTGGSTDRGFFCRIKQELDFGR